MSPLKHRLELSLDLVLGKPIPLNRRARYIDLDELDLVMVVGF